MTCQRILWFLKINVQFKDAKKFYIFYLLQNKIPYL